MATDVLTLKDDSATSSTYEYMGQDSNGASLHRDSASTLTEPRILRVSHNNSDKTKIDRHLVQLTRTEVDEDDVSRRSGAHVVLTHERDGVTDADLILEWEKLKNLVDANISRIISGFDPNVGSTS